MARGHNQLTLRIVLVLVATPYIRYGMPAAEGPNQLRKRTALAPKPSVKEQQVLQLLATARERQKDVEQVETRMAEIADKVDSGLNRDAERNLLQEMSKLRQRKKVLQKKAMAALDEAAGHAPSSPARKDSADGVETRQPEPAAMKLSRTERAAAESTPGALLKQSGEKSEIDWCALVMVYVKAAVMFALLFWLVRFQKKDTRFRHYICNSFTTQSSECFDAEQFCLNATAFLCSLYRLACPAFLEALCIATH